jgi:hypothetical protein
MPGGLAWHVPLVLVTPAILAIVAAIALRLAPRPWLAWVAVLPALALQSLLLRQPGIRPALAGPAVEWLNPGAAAAFGGLLGAALVLGWCRPAVPALGWRRPPPWRWCALLATALAIPLLPLPALASIQLVLLHGRRPVWRVRACGPMVHGAAVILSATWFVDPALAATAAAVVHLGAALALVPDRRTAFPLLATAANLLAIWW